MAKARASSLRLGNIARRGRVAGSDLEPNPRVESWHVGFMRKWAGVVNGIQRERWPEIRELIVKEQQRLGTRSDSAGVTRRDQLPKSILAVTQLVNEMLADYVTAEQEAGEQSQERVESIERSLESTSSTAFAENIESKIAQAPGVTSEEKVELSAVLIEEEPQIPKSVRRKWIREQLGLISGKPITPVFVQGRKIETISGRSMRRLKSIVTQGILKGTRVESIMKEVEALPGMTKRHAELIARDQVVKQNGKMTKIRHEGIGVTHYFWQTVGDERVRETHKRWGRKGKNRYSYKKGAGPNGVNPGEEIQCRCWASPDLLGALRSIRKKQARGDGRLRMPVGLDLGPDPEPGKGSVNVPGHNLTTVFKPARPMDKG